MDTKKKLLQVRFRLNMQRIAGMTALVVPGGGPPAPATVTIESEDVRADLFRTVVVFLHATFEDVLRTVARRRLGDAAPKVLENIPLVGTTKLGRAEKFHLGSLAAHRGKTVDHLIRESVDDYLSRESFGSCADVDRILRHMGLVTEPFKCLYADLDRMMKRRHRIVHEADLPSPEATSPTPWTIADYFHLCLWNLTVLTFYSLLSVSVDPADELQRWYFERRMKAIELFRQSPDEMNVLPDQYADAESMMVGFRRWAEELMQQVVAQLGPPSEQELLAITERIIANIAE